MTIFGKDHEKELGMSLDEFMKLVDEAVGRSKEIMEMESIPDPCGDLDFRKDMESYPWD